MARHLIYKEGTLRYWIAYVKWWITDRGKYTFWGTIDDPKPWGKYAQKNKQSAKKAS